jgi:deazaflavin-dependent oxidoreductase (nitroreductase family)
MAVADDLDRAIDSKWDWVAEQTRKYLATGGAEGHEWNGVYTLVLATTGRKTGQPRRTPVIYGNSGDDFVIVASKAGADEDPAWFKNLQAEPSVGVQVGARRFTARARVASPEEREGLWTQMVGIYPQYEEYAQKTDRVIPVVLLTPQD